MAQTKKSEASPPTLGEKLVEFFPSKHKDPAKAREQERGLQELVDLIVPQTKEDIAIDMALASFPVAKPFAKRGAKTVKKYFEDIGLGGGKKEVDVLIDKVKEGGQWLGNWMKGRKRNPNVVIPQSKRDYRDIFRGPAARVIEQGTHSPVIDEDLYSNPLKLGYSKFDPNNRNTDNPMAIFETVRGTYDRTPMPKIAINPHLTDEFYQRATSPRDIFSQTTSDNRVRLGVHEYTHALTKNLDEFPKEMEEFIGQMQKESLGVYNKPTARTYDMATGKWTNSTQKRADYIKDPSETYARIMELRYDIKADPLAPEIRINEDMLFKKNTPYTELREIYNHKTIQKMINTLPALAGLYLGTKAMEDNDAIR